MTKYLVIIEQSKTGYGAYVPDLSGCIATGPTKEEVEERIYEAIQVHIEGLKEDGLEIPKPKTESELMIFHQ